MPEFKGGRNMKQKTNAIITIALSVLICTSLVLLFVPYYAEGGTGVSLMSYTWFPTEHTELTESIGSSVAGHTVNDILTCTILIPLCGLAGLFLLWKFRDNLVSSALTGTWSLWALIWYAKNPVLRLGGGIWTAFIVLFTVTCALSIIFALRLLLRVKGEAEAKLAVDDKKQPVSSH